MEINTFIESVLIQIVEGTKNANQIIINSGATISSKDVRPLRDSTTYNFTNNKLVNLIEFDIALTVIENDKKNGTGGIKIAGIQFGAGIESETNNQIISRIKFSLPLTLPE